ncbi:nucleoporin protein Ndc1-Nup [Phlyctochytrium arcticum]|nr:nucleoporin protein Ndc1-Nup [Phlyctochytrium arcticum]
MLDPSPFEQSLQPELHDRLLRLAAGSFIATFYVLLWWSASLGSFLNTIVIRHVSPKFWLTTALTFVSLSLLIVFRLWTMQAHRRVASIRLSALLAFFGPDFWYALFSYWISAMALVVGYFHLKQSGNMFLVYPEGIYNTPRLREESAFVMAFSILLAVGYTISRRYCERDQLLFPRLQRKVSRRLTDSVLLSLQSAAKNTTKYLAGYIVAYFFFRRFVFNIAVATLGFWASNGPAPFSHYSPSALNLHTIVYAWLNGSMIYTCWELINNIFEVLFTQPPTKKTNLSILLTGLSPTVNTYTRYQAFLQLSQIVKYDVGQRQEIFMFHRDEPSGWKIISHECIHLLNQLSAAMENQQKQAEELIKASSSRPLKNANAFALNASKKQQQQNEQQPTPSIFSPTKRTSLIDRVPEKIVDAVYQSGSSARSPRSSSSIFSTDRRNSTQTESDDWAQSKPSYPELLRPSKKSSARHSEVSPTYPSIVGQPTAPSEMIHSPGQENLKRLRNWLLRWEWGRWVVGETLERQTRGLFKDMQLHLWAIEVLLQLVVASPTEDRFGETGRDLPRVIESLIRCQMALKTRLAKPPIRPSLEIATRSVLRGNQLLMREPYALLQVIETSMYRLVTTWYDSLGQLRLNPAYAKQFQTYVDFRE